VAPDFSGKFPGRGAWVTARRASVEEAMRRKAFSRAFRCEARVADDLADRVEAGFKKAALSALGLARRTGEAVTGFEKVRAGLKSNSFAVLVAATDGSEDGRGKLAALAGETAVVAAFEAAELSAALGRDVVHAAIRPGSGAERFLRESQRLEAFRSAP